MLRASNVNDAAPALAIGCCFCGGSGWFLSFDGSCMSSMRARRAAGGGPGAMAMADGPTNWCTTVD